VCLSHVVSGDVRVYLGRAHVGVAEHGLYAAQIRAAGQQMRGKRVAQLVGVRAAANAGGRRITAYDLPKALPRQRSAAR
jgi:hypothetical protein